MQTGPGPDPAPVVSLEDFAARCRDLNLGTRFAIAVSGGRDSMALACLCADYRAKTGAEILALTVDHGLRDGSDRDAAKAAQWCRDLGLDHKTLAWTSEKPSSGIQEAARKARYRLQAAAAQEAGFDAIVTAHSASDQAETVFMRLSRGAGVAGLGAMNAVTAIAAGPGARLRLIRPLLSFTRAQLTATVNGHGQSFIDDPGNDDPAFERVRTRALLAALEEQRLLTPAALNRVAARMRLSEQKLRAQEAASFDHYGGMFFRWGGVALDRQKLINAICETPSAGGLFRRIIHAVSGEEHGPDEKAAAAAVSNALATGAATLGGAIINVWRDRLWVSREPAALLGRAGVAPLPAAALPPDRPVLWDRRFILRAAAPGLTVKPLGPAGAEALGAGAALFEGPRDSLMALPGIYQGEALIGAPSILSVGPSGAAARALTVERFNGGIIRFS